MTPIHGGTTVERDPAGRSRSRAIVVDRSGDAAVYLDGSYIGLIFAATIPEECDARRWCVAPCGGQDLDETFVSGVEAVDALLGWFYENGPDR